MALSRQQSPRTRRAVLEALLLPWLLRAGFALHLFTAYDILLSRITQQTDVIDLVARLVGMLALAAVLLDVTERFNVHDVFGALLVMGIGGLLAFLLLDSSASGEIFLALAARALGANTLFGVVMLFSLVWLARAGRGGLFPLWLIPVGIIAGVWMRWAPFTGEAAGSIPLLWGVALLLWLSGAQLVLQSGSSREIKLTMSVSDGLVCAGLVLFSLSARAHIQLPTSLATVIALILTLLCLLMLWFQQRQKGESFAASLLRWGADSPMPRLVVSTRAAVWMLALTVGIVIGATLERGAGAADPIAAIGTLFTGFGLVWLPTVALVFGWRAIRRDVRAMRL